MSKSASFSLNQKISQLLMAERKRRSITQVAVAQRLKKPQSFVSKYENGQRQLTISDFIEICRAIEVNPADILKAIDRN